VSGAFLSNTAIHAERAWRSGPDCRDDA
jgi:hypothetical protein